MNFTEIIVAILVGWTLGMASTWLILARTLRWLDYRMLPKQGAKSGVQQSPALNSVAQSLPATQEVIV